MARFNQWTQLLKASATSRRHDEKSDGVKQERYLLLDTAMGSENSGDHVIMDACGCIADQIFGGAHMADQQQWALAKRLGNNRNVVLFGVGMSDIGVDDAIDAYTKKFYKTLLSDEYLHSVRDEMTKKRLNSIGIENVLNTACPTMWSLTPSKQLEISSKRSKNVVTSITDYCFDAERDRKMLELLSSEYEKVTIWVQGSHDVDWCLDQIVDLTQFNVIGPNIEDLNRVIETEEFDYVGTRLHAGIRCLNGGHRSLIIAIDNRARQIGEDTGLPVLEREDGYLHKLADWVNHPVKTEINLPWTSIDKWKKQFN